MPLPCNSLTTPSKSNKKPCDVTIKEFFGSKDLSMHSKYIIEAYTSLPKSCHTIGIDSSLLNIWMKTRHMMVLVANTNATTQGMLFATLGEKGATIYVNLLCTKRECHGAGRALMEHIMTVALKNRNPYLELHAVPSAVSFYTRLGFERVTEKGTPTPGTKRRRSMNLGENVEMRLNVLWYFSCFIRMYLSPNDKRNIGTVFCRCQS